MMLQLVQMSPDDMVFKEAVRLMFFSKKEALKKQKVNWDLNL